MFYLLIFSSDDSPTEEVLREARNRLKRLEEESEAVDRSYQDFRTRQADNLASATPRLFVPTQHTSPEALVVNSSLKETRLKSPIETSF